MNFLTLGKVASARYGRHAGEAENSNNAAPCGATLSGLARIRHLVGDRGRVLFHRGDFLHGLHFPDLRLGKGGLHALVGQQTVAHGVDHAGALIGFTHLAEVFTCLDADAVQLVVHFALADAQAFLAGDGKEQDLDAGQLLGLLLQFLPQLVFGLAQIGKLLALLLQPGRRLGDEGADLHVQQASGSGNSRPASILSSIFF